MAPHTAVAVALSAPRPPTAASSDAHRSAKQADDDLLPPPTISGTVDLVADVSIQDDDGAAVGSSSSSEQAGGTGAVAAQQRQQDATAGAPDRELTPEEDAAVAEVAAEFVQMYEQAFLSRAVQAVADFYAAHPAIPQQAIAQRLRGRGIDLAQLQARAAEVQRGIAECASDEGWRLIQDGTLRLLYRHTPGSTIHSFKGSCVLPAPMEQPLSMAREFDLVKTWNRYITHSRVLRTYCDMDVLVYASVWLPWPFAERDVLISAVADDHLRDAGVLAVTFASPPETPPDADLPPGADQRVHIYFSSGSCMTLTPVEGAPPDAAGAPTASSGSSGSRGDGSGGGGDGGAAKQQTRVTIVSNIDTQLQHVPEAIISFVLRVFAPFMFSTVLGVLHTSFDNPDNPLPQRLAAHHELYDVIRQRCADFLAGHPD